MKTKKKKRASVNYKTSEQFVGDKIVDWLFHNGWNWNLHRVALHQKGVDIRIQNKQSPHTWYFFIEVKGASSSTRHHGSADDASVVASIGQIITRMKVFTPNRYAVAFPEKSANIAIRRLPWQVAKKLLLSVFSVDTKGNVIRYQWKDIKKRGMLKA